MRSVLWLHCAPLWVWLEMLKDWSALVQDISLLKDEPRMLVHLICAYHFVFMEYFLVALIKYFLIANDCGIERVNMHELLP